MEEIAISKFKATCLAVLEKVKKTGQPILVTRFAHPIAQITPPAPAKRAPRLGTGADTGEILGDIVGSITDISEWDAWSNRTKTREPLPAGHQYLVVGCDRTTQIVL